MTFRIASLGLAATFVLCGGATTPTNTPTSPAASTAPAIVDAAFGNTIVSTYPDGRKGELWLEASGVYTAEGRRHDPSSGHWSVKGEKLCLKQSRPIWAPFSKCFAIPSDGMSAGFSATAVTGEPIRVTLVKGHPSGTS